MFKYLKASFSRKRARRFTREYPAIIENFELEGIGNIEFANWSNPLVSRKLLTAPMINFFKQFIKDGDLAIDIGANIGDTTVPMALCTGASGLTLGFDPNPYTNKILAINATLNKGKLNIVPVGCAISKEEEEYYFISSEASFSNGGISPQKESRHGKFIYPEKIKGHNLKTYLETNYPAYLNRLSFIKIDTEGYDKEIIKSISDLLKLYKPVIVAESFGKSSNEAKMELFDVVRNNGYQIYYFEDFSIDLKVQKLNHRSEITQWKETINIYGIPE